MPRSLCVDAHSHEGLNYTWLAPLGHGPVTRVEFQEPVGTGPWTLYTDRWWKTHCTVVGHNKHLARNHIQAFVNPKTRFAIMRFHFADGTVREASERFFRLEEKYFNG